MTHKSAALVQVMYIYTYMRQAMSKKNCDIANKVMQYWAFCQLPATVWIVVKELYILHITQPFLYGPFEMLIKKISVGNQNW